MTHEPGKVEASGDRSIAHKGDATGASFNTGDTHHHHYPATPPAPPSARHQLPGDLPEFTGRAAELAELEAALDRHDGATVAITALRGMGGVGKTTLALHAAWRLTQRYPDAQILIDLNGHGDGAPTPPLEAMQQVIRVFNPTLPLLDDSTQARAIYRDTLSGKRALILLDNAVDADHIRDLIPPPHCGALITARELVQPPGCTVLRLDLLPLDESSALLRALAPRAVGTDAEWSRLADLCGRLPLALRVAGSVLAAAEDLTLPDYLAELADEATRPHRLTIDGDASSNVAAVLNHSLHRLIAQDPTLAARWQMLSVVPADFDRAAAAALWEDTAAAPTLRALLARSLLLFDETTRRYRLHDLMRPLARNLFTPDLTQDPAPGTADRLMAAEGRFARHFMGVLEDAKEIYKHGHDKMAAELVRYDADSRNVAAAAHRMGNPGLAVGHLGNLGNAHAALGETRSAIDFHQQALAIAREIGDRHGEARDFGNLGNAHAALGDTRRAIEFHKQALAIAREIGDRPGEGNSLGNLNLAHADLGEIRRAIKFHQQALAIAREIGDRRGEGIRLGNLGLAHATLGETRRAIEFYQQALAIAREIGDRRGEGNRLGNLGLAHAALGETRRAIAFFLQALAIAREIGDRRGEGSYLGNLGNAYAALGKTRRAIGFFQQALAIAQEIGDRRGEGISLGNLGVAYGALGKTGRAIDFYQQALVISREIGERRGEGKHLGNLGVAHAALGETRHAIGFFQQALAIAREIGDRRGEGIHLSNLGFSHADLGEIRRAIDFYEQALTVAREIGDRRGEGGCLYNLANALAKLDDVPTAITMAEKALAIFVAIESSYAEKARRRLARLRGEAAGG